MPTEPFHRLFFAVRPPADMIAEIAALRDSFGQAKGIVADDQLHLTTWLFDDSQNFPSDAAARARTAVDGMSLTNFRIVLDRMVGGNWHVLLLPSEPLQGFEPFQASLDSALRAKGLTPRPGWRFNRISRCCMAGMR